MDVRACAAALEWEREARDALAFRRDGEDGDKLAAGETKTEGNENENENEEPDSNENDDEIPPDVAVLEDLRTRVSELDADILEEMEQPLVEEVTRRLDACDAWTARVDAIFAESGESSRGAPERERESARVGSAASLGASTREGGGSERAGAGGSERAGRSAAPWLSRLSAERAAAEARTLAGKRPTPEAVRALIEAGKKLPVPPRRAARGDAEEHAAWVERRASCSARAAGPTAEELAAAATSAADASADAAALEEALAAERAPRTRRPRRARRRGSGGGGGGSDDPHRLLAEGERTTRRAARAACQTSSPRWSRGWRNGEPPTSSTRVPRWAPCSRCSRGDSQPLRSEEGAALAGRRRRRRVVRAPPPTLSARAAGRAAAAVEDTASALRVVAQSIRAAIADLEGTGEPPESEEGQFCLCRQPGGKEMIGCDRCGDWYHLRCVQVTANFARTAKHYVCPACRASAPDGDVFELNKPETTHRHIHRTRRASLATLGEALLEAMAFRGKTEEEDLLVAVFDAHKAWRAAVAAATDRRAAVAGVEAKAAEARAEWEAAEAAAATPRDARLARARGVRERAAAVQQAQVLAGATAMAALLGAGGGGTAAAALEARRRRHPPRAAAGPARAAGGCHRDPQTAAADAAQGLSRRRRRRVSPAATPARSPSPPPPTRRARLRRCSSRSCRSSARSCTSWRRRSSTSRRSSRRRRPRTSPRSSTRWSYR